MDKYSVLLILEGKNKDAIANGNKFQGFLGISPEQFSKEELIMLCNILYDERQRMNLSLSEQNKKFFI